ncbi:transcriptional regulator [Rhodococcus sp. WMMA185]|uniref:GbsR/MarR family transcriptional regulator n=1 Tax=Rhodococcus sp. WMMA185 TaxID=679318 RepID=UPI000877ED45|nr:transcriptional regulator [Rhodococcus sp. WMMA185]AOW92639.1 transcriptional regulator [Rhodococcus sp. WMMA185]
MKRDGVEVAASTGSPADVRLSEFVERMGGYFESAGSTRLAGRLLGWLLVCEPERQSSEDLATGLRASSGGVSTTARLLIRMGLVERSGVPGDRRTYYRLRRHAFDSVIEERRRSMAELRKLAEEGLSALADNAPDRRRRLEEMWELAQFMEAETPALLTRYHNERRGGDD